VSSEVVLAQQDWMRRRDSHESRLDGLAGPYLRARAAGQRNPVLDFLFTYYNLKPRHLRRWHPGFGVILAGPGADEYAHLRGYCATGLGVTVDRRLLARRRETTQYVERLMAATASRSPALSCFGLHEWAMVYRAKELRHDAVPLRLGPAGTDVVVESLPLRCTHFDAYRFFTESARPLNATPLTRQAQVVSEQPGCVHATMDLYKFAAKLLPLVDSDLLMDAFELAYAARELDMCASPYDLRDFGYEAVAIERASGRAEYTRRQADLSRRAAGVRTALLQRCRELLAVSDEVAG
jgi:hypothetical protein